MSKMTKEQRQAKLQAKLQAKMGSETDKPKRVSYRDDNGKMLSLDAAKAKRWARKEDGQPTKIYELRLAKRAAKKAGEPIPVRQWTPKNAGQTLGELESPYDLNRRSGQALIWTVLANTPNESLTRDALNATVNAIYKARFPEYYAKKYSDAEFDAWTTAIVMNRAPFNAKIEALQQRVEVDTVAETVMLMTGVTEPRKPKTRGRKPGTKNKVTEAPQVEADDDNATDVGAEATADAATEATA